MIKPAFSKIILVPNIFKQNALKNQKGPFIFVKTLNEWITHTINKVVIDEYHLTWNNDFWLNYYFTTILPVFKGDRKLRIINKISNGYSWISILKNTYDSLIAYAINDQKSFSYLNLPLISKIAKRIREESIYVSLGDYVIVPENILEYEVLKLINRNSNENKKISLCKYEALSFYDEAASIINHVNLNLDEKRNEKIQIIIPSNQYFQNALKPIFLAQRVDYFFSERKKFHDSLICKLLFCIHNLFNSNFSYAHLLNFLFLIHNSKLEIKDKIFDPSTLIPFFVKYNIEENRFIDALTFEQDMNAKELEGIKQHIYNMFISWKPKPDTSISEQFYEYYSLLADLLHGEKPFLYSPGISEFFRLLTQHDDILFNNRSNNLNVTLFLEHLASSINIETSNAYFANQKIIVTTDFSILPGVKTVTFMGSDTRNYQYSKHKIDLPINDSGRVKRFYNYFNRASLELFNSSQAFLENYKAIPTKEIIVSYVKYQEDTPSTLSPKFSLIWENATTINKGGDNLLVKNHKEISQENRVDEEKSHILYSMINHSISASSLNAIFNDNYVYHLNNGIGINKYSEIRFDNALLGTWIHEVICLFFDKKKGKKISSKITTFLDWKKTEYSNSYMELNSVKAMMKVIEEIALIAPVLKRIDQWKILETHEIIYWAKYIAKKTAVFFCHLSNVYKKHSVEVESTELKIGKKRSIQSWILGGNGSDVLEIRGSIDQVISCYNKQLGRKEYYLIDFKGKAKPRLSCKKALLCADNQILLYMRAFLVHLEKGSFLRGFFYVPYYHEKEEIQKDESKENRYSIFVLEKSLKNFSQSFHDHIILNQNLTITDPQKLQNKFLTLELLQIFFLWYDRQIYCKYREFYRGVISSFPIKDDVYNNFAFLQPISWLPIKEYARISDDVKDSYKYLVSEIKDWGSGKEKGRAEYIKNYKEGM